ncbi:hypothetical protein D3C87_1396520 [compost metagenome]
MFILTRTTGTLGIAEPNAAMAVLRLYFRKEKSDFGQRPLPAGQNLCIAYRRLQRQEDRGKLYPGNAVCAEGLLPVAGFCWLRIHLRLSDFHPPSGPRLD